MIRNEKIKWRPCHIKITVKAIDQNNGTSPGYQPFTTYFNLPNIKYEDTKIDSINSPHKNSIELKISDKDFEFLCMGYESHHKLKVKCEEINRE